METVTEIWGYTVETGRIKGDGRGVRFSLLSDGRAYLQFTAGRGRGPMLPVGEKLPLTQRQLDGITGAADELQQRLLLNELRTEDEDDGSTHTGPTEEQPSNGGQTPVEDGDPDGEPRGLDDDSEAPSSTSTGEGTEVHIDGAGDNPSDGSGSEVTSDADEVNKYEDPFPPTKKVQPPRTKKPANSGGQSSTDGDTGRDKD